MATIKSQGSFSASVLSAQLPPKLVEATDGFIVSIVLPFPEHLLVRTIESFHIGFF